MDPRDTFRYRITVEPKNHLSSAKKDKSNGRDLSWKEAIVVFALLCLTVFLVIAVFGSDAVLMGWAASLIVFSLICYWFYRAKYMLVIAITMILYFIWYFWDNLSYI